MNSTSTHAVIIGGGFAGTKAARRFLRTGKNMKVTLIDRRTTFDFLPLLPDMLSDRIKPARMRKDLYALANECGYRFINAEVESIDLNAGEVQTAERSISYDTLIIAAGTQTTFFGMDNLRETAYTLDSTADGIALQHALTAGYFDNAVIVGGGYTGIEIATHIHRRFRRQWQPPRITVVELADRIMGNIPERMRSYSEANLRRLGIEVRTGTTVNDADRRQVELADGTVYPRPLLVWTAGVRTPPFIDELGLAQGQQGRLRVDEYLQAAPRVFIAGDTALVERAGKPLRPAVQFAITEGAVAADNAMRAATGKKLRRCNPFDPGFVVPMANNRSTGKALGIPVKDRKATFLHYFMCLARSEPRKRPGLIRDLLTR